MANYDIFYAICRRLPYRGALTHSWGFILYLHACQSFYLRYQFLHCVTVYKSAYN